MSSVSTNHETKHIIEEVKGKGWVKEERERHQNRRHCKMSIMLQMFLKVNLCSVLGTLFIFYIKYVISEWSIEPNTWALQIGYCSVHHCCCYFLLFYLFLCLLWLMHVSRILVYIKELLHGWKLLPLNYQLLNHPILIIHLFHFHF